MDLEQVLEIEWPWEMVPMEAVDEFIALIKDALPPGHELQSHDLFPGIKYDGRMVFIVDDDTAGNRFLMDFGKVKRWKGTRHRVPAVRVFGNDAEVSELMRRGNTMEYAKYNGGGTLKRRGVKECKHARRHHD